jgi:response regulator RpfG family c-di-GMP phosphodiesterase
MTEAAPLPRVLLVDDEPNVLDALRRQLRREFSVETAVGAANGLAVLGHKGPFAVVVSDFMMPGIDGAAFLAAARRFAPDTVRMVLTGHANLEGAASTVNDGQIFRLLLKPATPEAMSAALRDCVGQHELVVGERELLEQTLRGSVSALTDVLSLTSPTGFTRASRMRRLVTAMLDIMDVAERWPIELATMLAQLGVVSLPPSVAAKLEADTALDAAERAMVNAIPTVAEKLLSPIPRMAPVCEAIRYSRTQYNGLGSPDEHVAGDGIPLGGRILRLVQDYDQLTVRGMAVDDALATLRAATGIYDISLFSALTAAASSDDGEVHGVMLVDLKPGVLLAADARTKTDVLLAPRGEEVTLSLLARLHNFATLDEGVAEPLLVRSAGGVVKPVKAAEPTETAESAEPANLAEPGSPAEPAEPGSPAQAA